jgi:hypothetical protein
MLGINSFQARDYVRCTLYRSFVRQVIPAVENYFKDNSQYDPQDLDLHVNRIMQIGKWIKKNPTESDKQLAEAIVS